MILEPPMISLAVIALSLCHPGVCFQGSWSSAKTAYRDARDKLQDRADSGIVDKSDFRGDDQELETIPINA